MAFSKDFIISNEEKQVTKKNQYVTIPVTNNSNLTVRILDL